MVKTTILMSLVMLCAAVAAVAQDELAEGRKLLDAGKFEEAADRFRAVLEKDENNFEARSGMAEAKLGTGDADSAVFHAVKAEKIKPEDVGAIELTGRAFKAVGDAKLASGSDPSGSYAEAITSYSKLAKKQPKVASHQATLGYLFYFTNRLEESGDAYAAASRLEKKNAEYAYLGAQSYNLGQKLEKAKTLIDHAIAVDDKVARYHMMRGQILGNMKKLVEAGDAFAEVLVAKDVTAEMRTSAASSMWNCYSPSKTWKPYAEKLAAWTKKDKKNHTAWWWLGYVQLQDGEYEGAYKSYGQANKVSGGWAEALFYQGMARKAQEKIDDALKLFKKAGSMPYNWAANSGPVFQIRVIMGERYGKGQAKEAIQIGEDFCLPVAQGANRLWVLNDLGLFTRDLGGKKNWKKSRKYYEEAVELFDSVEGLTGTQKAQVQNDCGLMYVYYDLKDEQTAVKHYRKALEYDPTYTDACLNYARILTSHDEHQKALDVLEKAADGSRQDIVMLRRQLESKLK